MPIFVAIGNQEIRGQEIRKSGVRKSGNQEIRQNEKGKGKKARQPNAEFYTIPRLLDLHDYLIPSAYLIPPDFLIS
jgi:hypothetical protein